MPNDEKLKALLSDLGKSTLRGVRKCPKCGTYNGTRGLSCKNKACDVVFKEAGEKRKQSTEVCKLITGNSTQIFSVRVRDKGPDYRGFVQLPVVQPNVIDAEGALITQTGALCFVETCQRTFTNKILRCHEKDIPLTSWCQHIHAALRCCTVAQPLTISDNALSSLQLPSQVKQIIWQVRSESSGPLVQRVSKNIMVVKCKVNAKHPVGYLHVSFGNTFKTNTKESQVYYTCSCPAFKTKSNSKNDDIKGEQLKRCVHYYSCVAAIASDPKLSEEFNVVLDVELPSKDNLALVELELNNSGGVNDVGIEESEEDDSGRRQLVAILGDVVDGCEVEVEVLPEEATSLLQQYSLSDEIAQLQGLEVIQNMDASSDQLVTDNSQMLLLNERSFSHFLSPEVGKFSALKKIKSDVYSGSSVKRKRDDATSALLTLQEGLTHSSPKRPIVQRSKYNQKSVAVAEGNENNVHQSFMQWLASVTERINQTMHYQFDGKPAPLVFHAPQAFFECLKERISIFGCRKRLPNQTVAFHRKDSVPLGTFTKYSWHINNIIHCKQIFETPLMPLDITRSFIENQDGTYDLYDSHTIHEEFSKTNNKPRIKPLEHKTFLKVGNTSQHQITPTPFIIEWMPDVLPISRIGELRLIFEYGHLKPS